MAVSLELALEEAPVVIGILAQALVPMPAPVRVLLLMVRLHHPSARPPDAPKPEDPKPEEPKPQSDGHKNAWEKAREETRRKEEERKAREAEQKRKEEIAKRLRELREKEARERAKREQAAREKAEAEARAAREKAEAAAKAAREKAEAEAKAAREKAEAEAKAKAQREQEQKEKEEKERLQREKEQAIKDKVHREARLREARERELRERLERERALREKLEKEAMERESQRLQEEAVRRIKEAAEKRAKEEAEKRAKEATEKRIKEEAEKRAKELAEKLAKEAAEKRAKEEAESRAKAEITRKSTYAFSSVGERTNPWPNGRPPSQAPSQAPSQPASPAVPSPAPSSVKRPPPPTAKATEGDGSEYSYRPYDTPKQHHRRRSGETVFTESSYAYSQSTSRTSPPPSERGAYSTKDPDKIVIKAVYSFMNQFAKTPASQLFSGQGTVTDGLILRITTEGLFIDDDVRGVPQREWDVKAWTLKLMEVWCPSRDFAAPAATPTPAPKGKQRARMDRGQPKVLTGDEADTFLTDMLRTCKNDCRLCPHGDGASAYSRQSGEFRQQGLHVLRATIRDQEGKRYMFVLGEEEGWKVSLGLQRLRRGTQVRQLGVQAMSVPEARNTLELLGWT
ncbi:hypothetical protein PG994_003550 [Apiospora phragmitis]|uniref:Uncharacterized protein n=1 Tax=Apiospora phragmitis TaxID=2905665 RepID=A0ABR1W2A9_9PEZI